jgi:hypothetical protein
MPHSFARGLIDVAADYCYRLFRILGGVGALKNGAELAGRKTESRRIAANVQNTVGRGLNDQRECGAWHVDADGASGGLLRNKAAGAIAGRERGRAAERDACKRQRKTCRKQSAAHPPTPRLRRTRARGRARTPENDHTRHKIKEVIETDRA